MTCVPPLPVVSSILANPSFRQDMGFGLFD